jgi:hypothetical protein
MEWIEEVQGLLERDAGWGWRGFWDCVRGNLDVRLCLLTLFFLIPAPWFPILLLSLL